MKNMPEKQMKTPTAQERLIKEDNEKYLLSIYRSLIDTLKTERLLAKITLEDICHSTGIHSAELQFLENKVFTRFTIARIKLMLGKWMIATGYSDEQLLAHLNDYRYDFDFQVKIKQ